MSMHNRILTAPAYNLARGPATVTSTPPYEFSGVTIWFLPLRARIDQLRRFCDQYLNFIPKQVAEFRPSFPYVFLQLVHYDRMASEMHNAGWLSQHEIVFSVFLDWYRKIDGEYVYYDSASVSPFIFVDQTASQATGREVYGWPKMQGRPLLIDSWPGQPLAPHVVTRIGSHVFSEVYTGGAMETAAILEIEKEPSLTPTSIPPNFLSPSNPVAAAASGFANVLSWNARVLDMLMSLPSRGYEAQGWPQIPRALLRTMSNYARLTPPTGNTVNLKQFRDAERPAEVCYQAVVNAQMTLSRFNQGGMLGDMELLRGDSTGGYRVRLNEYPNLPVAELLGLEIDHEETGANAPVAVMRPDFPFWVNVNLSYTHGDNLCWRSRRTRGWWLPPKCPGDPPKLIEDTEKNAPSAVPGHGHLYDTTLGAAIISLPGPFHMPNTTIRVLPLLADRKKLQTYVDHQLNPRTADNPSGLADQPRYRFEVFGRYVYMIIWNTDEAHSERDDIGHIAGNQIRFSIPVRVFRRSNEGHDKLCSNDDTPISSGLISPYAYTDNDISAVTARELYGLEILCSQIQAPADNWLATDGPDPLTNQSLLTLNAPVMPTLFMGQEEQSLRLLEIHQGHALDPNDPLHNSEQEQTWGQTLAGELIRKTQNLEPPGLPSSDKTQQESDDLGALMALALEFLGNGMCINDFTLKQFRDAEHPQKACYQGIVRVPMVCDNLYSFREIESELHVRIYRIAGQPIVETLGLESKLDATRSGGSYYILQPVRPFWFRTDLRIDPAEDMWTAVVGEPPLYPAEDEAPRWEGYFTGQQNIQVGVDMLKRLKDHDSTSEPPFWRDRDERDHLQRYCREWLQQQSPGYLTMEAAIEAVLKLEPQMAIEAILSREWGYRGLSRAKVRLEMDDQVKQKPPFCVRRDSVGKAGEYLFPKLDDDRAYALTLLDRIGWFPGEKHYELPEEVRLAAMPPLEDDDR